jgi:hypothetical protein
MKALLSILLLLICINSNAQFSLTARIADSNLKGLAGIELQRNHWSIATGWKPCRISMEIPDKWVHAYSGAVTYYFESFKTSPYLSIGVTSKGIAYKELGEFKTSPTAIITGGVRCYVSDYAKRFPKWLFFDLGAGINISNHFNNENSLVIEFCINFRII